MTAVEQLARAILDGRVRVELDLATNGLGIPSGATIYIDVDPIVVDQDDAP